MAQYRENSKLLTVLDLLGTFVFAVEGAMAAIRGGLDLLGLFVLAFVTALGGGIIRDILIGAVPPASLRNWRYPVIAFAGGICAFFLHQSVDRVPPLLMFTLDAVGLALFAVAGAEKALEYGMHPLTAILMGGITGVGGGTIRDVLLAQVPLVLRSEVYATGALAGAAVLVLGRKLKMTDSWAAFLGSFTCFALRMLAVWKHWTLPRWF